LHNLGDLGTGFLISGVGSSLGNEWRRGYFEAAEPRIEHEGSGGNEKNRIRNIQLVGRRGGHRRLEKADYIVSNISHRAADKWRQPRVFDKRIPVHQLSK